MTIQNSKKVTLVSLSLPRKEFPYLPGFMYSTAPGMHYINAILKENGFKTNIINQAREDLTSDEIISKIIRSEPEIILFNQFNTTRQQIKEIISKLPEEYTCGIGGHDVTFHSQALDHETLNKEYDKVNFIWQGEIENGFIEFLKTFNKGNKPILLNNLNKRLTNLDKLSILKHNDYSGDMGFIYTSRGCLSTGCDFCTTPQMYLGGLKSRSFGHIQKELINLKKNNKKYICIFDDNFFGFTESDLEKSAMVIKKAKELDMKLFIMTRVEQIIKANEKGYLSDFRGTVTKIFLGVENGSLNGLKKIGKKCKVSKYSEICSNAIDLLYKNGIAVYLGYINFYPDVTFDELENSAKFLYDNHQNASCFHHLYNKLDLFDGTPLLNKLQQENIYNINVSDEGYSYDFKEKNIGFLSDILNMFVVETTNILDFLIYESTFIIFMNQLQDSKVGQKYLKIKKEVNQNNYDYFMNAIDICKKNPEIGHLVSSTTKFKKQTINSIIELKNLFPEIIEKSKYIYEEPLKYIETIPY